MSDEERQNILSQHKSLYNGYAVGNVPSNQTPLTVGDYATDKGGITVNSNGEVTEYKNHKINESKELDEIGLGDLKKGGKYKYKKPYDGEERRLKYIDKIDYEEGEPHYQFGDDEKFSALLDKGSVERDINIDEELADDMDLSDVEPGYDFESGGPEEFESSYDDMDPYDMDLDMIQNMFDFEDIHGSDNDAESMIGLTDMMDNEFSGKEKLKGEKSPFNFRSQGADQDVFGESILREQDEPLDEWAKKLLSSDRFSMIVDELLTYDFNDEFDFMDNVVSTLISPYTKEDYYDSLYEHIKDKYGDMIMSMYGSSDTMFSETKESMCEQCGLSESMCECGMYEEMDEELHETFKQEKNKINEMFNRFKNYN